MTLDEALAKLESLDEEDTLYVVRPWSGGAECVIAPTGSKPAGYEYFLDAATALEVLDVLDEEQRTPEKVRKLLIYYAENDAYPTSLD